MNRLRAARHPVIHWTPFTFWIGPIFVMAEILSGLASMSRSETMKPSSMPLGTPENALLGVEFDAIRSEFCKSLLKVGNEVVSLFGLNYDVVDVSLNGPPDEVPEAFEHTALVCGPSVLQTE